MLLLRNVQEDKSGWCSRKEMRQLVANLNLESVIRPVIIEELIRMMDVDGDDQIQYKEFARVITADDVFDMAALREKSTSPVAKKLTKAEKKRMEKINLGLI